MYAVEVKDLVKNYGSFQAVKGISFNVREGEVYGLIGPNGAGKTTALRILSTLLEITAGEVKIYGIDLGHKPDEVRRIISYLPEDAGAYKNLTGRAYLKFIAQFFAEGDKAEELVSRGLEIAHLEERIDDKVETYSKGMARRLLVARALMIKPKLAILDELTSGLDVINAQEIRRTVKTYASQGTTMLLSSHNMLEVELLCDRIALINDGEIVAEGTPDELKERYGAKNIEEVFVKVVSE
ncbi:MAG TPA: ABC transporter ATP-binding protein [Methanomassiliicoccales archaeon]|nr:ABC transporter ATP-binding protein [Methanomassiliicoccales archaeon]